MIAMSRGELRLLMQTSDLRSVRKSGLQQLRKTKNAKT